MNSYQRILLENKPQFWEDIACIETSIALQPTVVVLNNDIIRVYAGHIVNQDPLVAHVGYFDLDSNFKYINSQFSVLEAGKHGSFDSYGVVPSVIFHVGNVWYMFYAGYQQLKDVRFCVFGGLAVSNDNNTWHKISPTPIFERTREDLLFRVPHAIMLKNNGYAIWYCGGSHFRPGHYKTLPVYTVKYIFTSSIVNPILQSGQRVIELNHYEHRCGRPSVVMIDNRIFMWYGISTEETTTIGFASGTYPNVLTRHDHLITFTSKHTKYAYPNVIEHNGELLMFYNDSYGLELSKNPMVWIAKLRTDI